VPNAAAVPDEKALSLQKSDFNLDPLLSFVKDNKEIIFNVLVQTSPLKAEQKRNGYASMPRIAFAARPIKKEMTATESEIAAISPNLRANGSSFATEI